MTRCTPGGECVGTMDEETAEAAVAAVAGKEGDRAEAPPVGVAPPPPVLMGHSPLLLWRYRSAGGGGHRCGDGGPRGSIRTHLHLWTVTSSSKEEEKKERINGNHGRRGEVR